MAKQFVIPSDSAGKRLADVLNRDCHCISVNRDELQKSLEAQLRDADLAEQLLRSDNHLFADTPVFLWQGHISAMEQVIQAVGRVARNEAYRE